MAEKIDPNTVETLRALHDVEKGELRAKLADINVQYKHTLSLLRESDGRLNAIIGLKDQIKGCPVKHLKVKAENKTGESTAVLVTGDWHIEERVDPKTVDGVNEYNPTIAEDRITKFFQRGLALVEMSRTRSKIDTLVLAVLGDLITNTIHEDLAESNYLSPTEASLKAYRLLCGGIDFLLKEGGFKKIIIPCCSGNHDRTTHKPRIHTALKNSYSWLMYQLVAERYAKEDKINVIVADGYFVFVDIYGKTLRFHHGDDVAYHGGVGGLDIPLNKSIAQWNKFRRADIDILGHWHTRKCSRDFVVNGCFASGTRVITPLGIRPIEIIARGDKVLSRDGSIQIVENTIVQKSNSVIRIRVKGLPNFILVTPNHEIWAIKGESTNEGRPSRTCPRSQTTILQETPRWIRAEYLSEGDWVHTPNLKGTRRGNKDLLFAYGLFMAEGHTILDGGASHRHNRIEYSMHIDELPILESVKKTLEVKYPDASSRIWVRKDKTTSHISLSGREISRKFRHNFGHLSSGKKVPRWMFELDTESRKAVVKGWMTGDGTKNGKTGVTISEQLAWGMYLLSIGTGLEPVLYCCGSERVKGKIYTSRYEVRYVSGQDVRWVNGERFLRIDFRRKENKELDVYDLQVSGEHTYCVEGIGVHNSVIGFSPYSLHVKASFEPPCQSFFLMHPHYGKTLEAPIFLD